ncbi:hypothetical protein ACFQEQ_11155 [Halolamina salina]|uniref:hypothetical protein n=1 Tax=Halolamina salina TaxID=1220023 RepID=UPI0036103AF2
MSELLLCGGTVQTLDDDRRVADSVLFRDDRVATVGDAVVLDSDPYENADSFDEIGVELTVLDGEVV